MGDFVIMTDSGCDLPPEFIEENRIVTVSFAYTVDDEEFLDDFGRSQDHKSFYDRMRQGARTRTSQANVSTFTELFSSYASQGVEVLYIGLSSGLTGTLNSAILARQTVLEEYPNAGISIVDSRSASLGQGILVRDALQLKAKGWSREETVRWLEENKLRLNHWFTVDDLEYLRRGGRLSTWKAAVGGILNVKPVLHMDAAGHLVPVTKVRGRKKSIKALAEFTKKRIVSSETQVIGISHADCLEEAEQLADLIRAEVSVKDVIICQIGPVIGAHSGPGTLAVFFYGRDRNV